MPHKWDAQEREHCRLDMHRIAEIPRAIDQDTARAAWFRKWGAKLDADLIGGRGDPEIEVSLERAEVELSDTKRALASAEGERDANEKIIERALEALSETPPDVAVAIVALT